MKSCLYTVFFLAILISRANGDTDNLSTDPTQLRKISASTIFQGLANTASQAGKLAGSKTKKEEQENTCNLIGTLFQFGAEASKEHEESKQKKNKKKEEQKQEKKKEKQKKAKENKAANNSDKEEQGEPEENKTKSIETSYIDQFQELTSDEERKCFLDAILQNKEATEKLIDELNFELKTILIEALFE